MTEPDLTLALREQMRAFTAADAPSPDLVRRVHAGIRRRRQHRLSVVAGVAVAGSVTGVALAIGGGQGSVQLRTGGPSVPAAQSGPVVGPSDDELRTAQWFSYESQPEQSDLERAPEQRWEGRDGRHLARQPDGSLELFSARSRFPFGDGEGLTWDELLALRADPVELDRRMRQAGGGRPPEERVLDQVRQLLARSPALLPVRRALVEAALGQDGATLRQGQQDSQGRPALLLERTDRDGAVLQLWLDPAGFRLLEERTITGPDFPTPPTEGPVSPVDAVRKPGELLYRETYLRWTTSPPPAS